MTHPVVNRPTPALYYDGRSADPQAGMLLLTPNGLRFEPVASSAIDIHFSRVAELNRLGPETMVELKPEQSQSVGHTLRFTNPPFHQHLAASLAGRPGLSAWRTRLAWRRLSWHRVLLLALIILPTSFLAVQWIAAHAYRLIPLDMEVRLGEYVYDQLMKDFEPCDNPALSAYLDSMADLLVDPDSPYECRVTVVRTPEPNAFALPGGHIVLFSGMLDMCDSPEGVVGVLAHEIAHVEQQHSLQYITKAMGTLIFFRLVIGAGLDGLEGLELAEFMGELTATVAVLHYSRDAEAEADDLGAAKLHRNQKTVAGLIQFFSDLDETYAILPRNKGEVASETDDHPTRDAALEALGWLSTHPLTHQRVERLNQYLAEEPETFQRPSMADDEWHRLRDGCFQQAGAGRNNGGRAKPDAARRPTPKPRAPEPVTAE